MIKDYYFITKPGIVGGNAITVIAGFFLASGKTIDWLLLFVTLVGLSLVVASGCVFNNYIDRDIDGRMERTKNRALVKGIISPRSALIYATHLGVLGFFILFFYTNLLTSIIALVGLFVYVIVYSLWLKRNSVYGTIVGSISGAVPPVVGYLAVNNTVDMGVVFLFFILAFWQIPHSLAIAIYRLSDYTKAKIPVLPVKKGIRITKMHMLVYIALFIIATLMLPVFSYAGYAYFFVMTLLGLVWLGIVAIGFYVSDNISWARDMFVYSIVILVVFCVIISAESLLW